VLTENVVSDCFGIDEWKSYVLGYCEPCLVAIITDYEERLAEPIDVEVIKEEAWSSKCAGAISPTQKSRSASRRQVSN
jgi:hypothetical protein